MPIYPALNLVFVHVPKTAGGAIEELLLQHKAPGQKTTLNRLLAKVPIKREIMRAYIPGHATAQYLQTRMGPKLWQSYTSFAVIRNPYDMAISAYEFERQTPRHHRHARTKKMRFPEYVAERGLSQSRFVCDAAGAVVVDHLIKFEELHEQLDRFFAKMGVSERLPTKGDRNSSKKQPRDSYLTPDVVEIINTKAKADFENFDYKMMS